MKFWADVLQQFIAFGLSMSMYRVLLSLGITIDVVYMVIISVFLGSVTASILENYRQIKMVKKFSEKLDCMKANFNFLNSDFELLKKDK